jgi:hypothetical protein
VGAFYSPSQSRKSSESRKVAKVVKVAKLLESRKVERVGKSFKSCKSRQSRKLLIHQSRKLERRSKVDSRSCSSISFLYLRCYSRNQSWC